MPMEEFRVQLAMLLDQLTNQPEDLHEVQESLREKLAEMQAMGLPPPDDLVGLEKYLDETFIRTGRVPDPDRDAGNG